MALGQGASAAAEPGVVDESVPPPAVAVPAVASSARALANWSATLERIASSVVAIKVDSVRAFDTEGNATAQATGFVVDAEHGLILTNRHVVTPGPVTAEAVFLDREEVPLVPVYRDPVHDFGFYRYDPSRLKFIKPKALPLHPEGAEIGREIRVIGNNAGEQLSILAGTLARLDRDAPEYGLGRYNDFNTFYLQAASGTSGGSSGSPVVDIDGGVVALNAGGSNGSASSFYLPLGRVRRALEFLRRNQPVPRGTLETVFRYRPYDELRRLGLDPQTEARTRRSFPALTGMLVVDQVEPGSPAAGVLQTGDVLVRIDGKPVTQFEPLEEILDGAVGHSVELELERGGSPLRAQLVVSDLDALMPDEYLEFGDAVLNPLSWQEARHFNVPIRGVFVANPGYVLGAAGVPRGAVVTALGGQAVAGLDDLAAALERLGDGDRAAMRFFTLDDPNGSQLRSIRMDRRWFVDQRCRRNDATGVWDCQPLKSGPPPRPLAVASARFPAYPDRVLAAIAPSLVSVGFDMPYSISGITERNYRGTGLVVDAARGLVVVDRNTVPVSLGDVRITFAGTLEIPGRVVYIHPLHNLAIVAYDPKLIGSTPVRSATLSQRELLAGDPVRAVGFGADGALRWRSTQVAEMSAAQFPLSRTMAFRESNLETAQLVNPPTDFDGVLLAPDGSVQALWSTFGGDTAREPAQEARGVPIGVVAAMLRHAVTGSPLHSLEAEFAAQPLANARRLGLGEPWLQRLEVANPVRRQVLEVTRLVGGSPAAASLLQGDLLLSVDGKVVTRFSDVERAVADQPRVTLEVWRGEGAKRFDVDTVALTGDDVDRVLQWGGATLQALPRALLAQRSVPPVGVYVAFLVYGSPASHYGLYPGRRIVEVDGQATPDLDRFLQVVAGRADRASLRLKTLAWNNAPEVITVKLDPHYWPAYELRRTDTGWERRPLE